MNKKSKLAIAALSVLMAGTMAFGMFGCGDKNKDNPDPVKPDPVNPDPVNPDPEKPTGVETVQFSGEDANAAKLYDAVKTKLNGVTYVGLCQGAFERLNTKSWVAEGAKQEKLTATKPTGGAMDINFNIGDKNTRSIAFIADQVVGNLTLVDGSTVAAGDLKPVWKTIQGVLSEKTGATLTFKDLYFQDSGKLDKIKSDSAKNFSDYDLITDGVTNVTKYQSQLLDLSNYLDEMPNYKKFLNANPTVRDSLTFNGGSMYYAPYFDGYNDVEKYSLFRTNWVEALLDASAGDATQTWAASMTAKEKTATQASIESYMGKTGSWKTDVLDKDGKKVAAGITVNYDKALAAAKGSDGLGAAVTDAAGAAYTGDSGNIVDIMNYVINTKQGDVTGAKLLKIMQEYIKVAYYVGGTETAFYTQSGYKLSDVFNGNSAAWDVDLFAALGRVMITNPSLLTSGKGHVGDAADATELKNVYLVTQREANMQRGSDILSWVGELYGVRGLESRFGYSYIDSDGYIQDARLDENSYRAMKAFSGFYQEGLVFAQGSEKPATSNPQQLYYAANGIEAMCEHDYLNTQTPMGFGVSGNTTKYDGMLGEGYNFTANLTAVSKWDEDEDGKIQEDEYFRFTESWRSVKDQGICIPLDSVKNDPQKLYVLLSFIDYIFSDDGQITMAYGARATDKTGNGGLWYNPEATSAQISDGKYFEYNGKKYYSETYYQGKYVPTLTDNVMAAYVGTAVNGYKYDKKDTSAIKWGTDVTMNYTEFARSVMGSALNFGNKLTSLEYQLTCEMGKRGAEKVDNAITSGIIRHVTPSLAEGQSTWYQIAPTCLPFTKAESDTDADLVKLCADMYQKGTANTIFTNSKNTSTNLYYEIIVKGYDFANFAEMFSSLSLA